MKIVIDISENIYTRLFDNGIETSVEDREAIYIAIRSGMPIPKKKSTGLKDYEDELFNQCYNACIDEILEGTDNDK